MEIKVGPRLGGYCGYYIAELDEQEVTDPIDTWGHSWYPEADDWCNQTFGPSDIWGEESVNGWKRIRNKYFFVEQSSLAMFILRWS